MEPDSQLTHSAVTAVIKITFTDRYPSLLIAITLLECTLHIYINASLKLNASHMNMIRSLKAIRVHSLFQTPTSLFY